LKLHFKTLENRKGEKMEKEKTRIAVELEEQIVLVDQHHEPD